MTDYVKELEARVEELQQQLTLNLTAFNALKIFADRQSFFQYTMNVRKNGQEWSTWNLTMSRKEAFAPFTKFKTSLLEYDQVAVVGSRYHKEKWDDGQVMWVEETCWQIELKKEKRDWIITSISLYGFSNTYDKLIDDPLSDHISRWRKDD
jgi:hypothetical protein